MKTYSHCPICNHQQFQHYLTCKDYTCSNEAFDIVQCDNCQFIFTNPIPEEKEIHKYYESEEYISHSNTSKGIVNTLYQYVRTITTNKKVALIKSLSKGKKLLDIGSGTGEFLNACQKRNLDVIGIEPSETGRLQSIENFQLSVYQEDKLSSLADSSFDFITMWHVLEHVYHLNDRIKAIHRLLKEDGHLIVAVPNRDSQDANHYKEHWAAYDVPRHLYHFSPNDIENLFSNHQFQLIKTLPMVFDAFYVSMLSEKYKKGKLNLFAAFLNGLKSNLKANNKRYSSQIYILKKKKGAE